TTQPPPLPLHDALPIWIDLNDRRAGGNGLRRLQTRRGDEDDDAVARADRTRLGRRAQRTDGHCRRRLAEDARGLREPPDVRPDRSEEHTSELQSPYDLV